MKARAPRRPIDPKELAMPLAAGANIVPPSPSNWRYDAVLVRSSSDADKLGGQQRQAWPASDTLAPSGARLVSVRALVGLPPQVVAAVASPPPRGIGRLVDVAESSGPAGVRYDGEM